MTVTNGVLPINSSRHKITATRIFDFACAHNLLFHSGKCKYFHGHNYKLHITVSALTNDSLMWDNPNNLRSSMGMVVDFSALKNIVNELIIEPYDHSFIVWVEDKEHYKETSKINAIIKETIVKSSIDELEDSNIKVVNFRPTAENMCIHFYNILKDALRDRMNVKIDRIRLYETDNSYAEMTINDDRVESLENVYHDE